MHNIMLPRKWPTTFCPNS